MKGLRLTKLVTLRCLIRARPILASVAACLCLGTGCVLTPLEGIGEPPRILQVARAGLSSDAPDAIEAGPSEIAASHLLVMHQDSLHGAPDITRTKAEAKVRAEEALTRARAGEDFAKLVAEYSDEPGAASRGGSLGRFDRTRMVPSFSRPAFALKVGELSGVVETSFGYHVILRTE